MSSEEEKGKRRTLIHKEMYSRELMEKMPLGSLLLEIDRRVGMNVGTTISGRVLGLIGLAFLYREGIPLRDVGCNRRGYDDSPVARRIEGALLSTTAITTFPRLRPVST